jgi:hypothetical protein
MSLGDLCLCLKGKKKRRRAFVCEGGDGVDVVAACRDGRSGGARALPEDDKPEWWWRGGRKK